MDNSLFNPLKEFILLLATPQKRRESILVCEVSITLALRNLAMFCHRVESCHEYKYTEMSPHQKGKLKLITNINSAA